MAISAWSQAPRRVHFFWLPIPAYAFLPFVLTLFHLRVWTICLTLLVVGVLGYLSFKGRTVQWLMRRAQLSLRGGGMQARPVWYRRRTQMRMSLDVVPLPHSEELSAKPTAAAVTNSLGRDGRRQQSEKRKP